MYINSIQKHHICLFNSTIDSKIIPVLYMSVDDSGLLNVVPLDKVLLCNNNDRLEINTSDFITVDPSDLYVNITDIISI